MDLGFLCLWVWVGNFGSPILKILCWCVWVFCVYTCGLKLGLWWWWVCVVGASIDDCKFFSFCGYSLWLVFFFFFLCGRRWCWQWWVLSLPLTVVMDLGEYERRKKKIDAGSNHNPCVVSVWWVPPFWRKVDLKVELCEWVL